MASSPGTVPGWSLGRRAGGAGSSFMTAAADNETISKHWRNTEPPFSSASAPARFQRSGDPLFLLGGLEMAPELLALCRLHHLPHFREELVLFLVDVLAHARDQLVQL